MVSFVQLQCLSCGTVDDVVSMGGEGESTWCSSCGFTRRTAEYMGQERRLQQQLIAEDEQLAALLSKNMWLSERQHHLQQQPTVSAGRAQTEPLVVNTSSPPPSSVEAAPGANFSISQHYHHYRPVAQPASEPVPVPTQSVSSAPYSYIQHIVTTSVNPEAALESYHRELTQMEEQYHHRVQQQQQRQQYPPSPTGSTVSSIQDDHQLQLILLEQHNLAIEAEKLRLARAQEEEQMLLNQLMYTRDDVMSDNDDDLCWAGGQPMPDLVEQQQHHQQQDVMGALKVVYPRQPWVASGEEEDIYGMDDEESPCSIYYSRMTNFL